MTQGRWGAQAWSSAILGHWSATCGRRRNRRENPNRTALWLRSRRAVHNHNRRTHCAPGAPPSSGPLTTDHEAALPAGTQPAPLSMGVPSRWFLLCVAIECAWASASVRSQHLLSRRCYIPRVDSMDRSLGFYYNGYSRLFQCYSMGCMWLLLRTMRSSPLMKLAFHASWHALAGPPAAPPPTLMVTQ